MKIDNKFILSLWEYFLIALAIIFLVVYSLPAFNQNLSIEAQENINIIQWFCWLVFAIDLIYRFVKAENKKIFIKTHPLEIIAVLIPFLRPLRLLRLISVGSLVIQKISIGKSVAITVRLAIISIFMSYIAAIEITQAERNAPNGNIESIWDGLWWALTTITTVGYGDRYPTTTEGRLIALGLMLLGISLLGVISATLAAWFIRVMQKDDEAK
ncbi:MAG: potassium channel family protein [Candidatus Nanopelagicales bacterium]